MTSNLTRRAWLAGAVLLASPGRATRGRTIDPIGRSRPSHLKLSLAAYSFRKDLESQKLDMFGFLKLAADYGLDGVEPTSYWFPKTADAAYFHKLRQEAFLLGLDISGTAIRNDFCLAEGPKRDADLDGIKKWIDRAAELNAPVIRVFGGTIPKGETRSSVVPRVIAGIESVLPHAVEKGVTLAIENHGGVTASPADLLEIVRGVKAPSGCFGVNLDTGNFRGVDPYSEFAELAPYAVNVQVKTEITPKGKPKQDADLARFVTILRQAKYSGYIVLEHEADEDPYLAVPKHLKALRALFG